LRTLLLTISAALLICSEIGAEPVTDERLREADSDTANWLTHGRTYQERRYSPLDQINDATIEKLGLAWTFETATERGLQATPLVVDGVMFFTGAWSVVYALDARDGSLLWKYDPKVPRQTAYKYCCGVVNRGVAIWQNSIYVGALDGRLISIDAQTGTLNWQTQTVDTTAPYSITGAPRVANGKIIIGNGGAEFGVRGYVSAYDGLTGEQLWRFYTVPGNPADGFENASMEMAAKTWKGQWWRYGGGGTVWDSIAFDPDLNLLYIGVGNGGPHNQEIRSPGGGDNLFLTSIIALNPDSGEYVWHYQQVNGETWDYTATQQMVLQDIVWQGEPRKVIMQAPKAGFFYLIDRTSGALLSAEPYVTVNWASHIDMETSRPVERPAARYKDGTTAMVFPTGIGGHNWHSMSYSPATGLMYIPAIDMGTQFTHDEDFVFQPNQWNLGYDTIAPPDNQLLAQALIKHVPKGFLLAWDPLKQQEIWRAPHTYIGNGGTLATAGNLVFQGTIDGSVHAYQADSGSELWSMNVQNGVMAAPITYAIDGEQYVTFLVGRGGGMSMILGVDYNMPATKGRAMTFKLGATGELPPVPASIKFPEPPPESHLSDDDLENGQALYNKYCARCHGVNAVSDGSIPDLRRLPKVWHENFAAVVLQGMAEGAGMPRFDDVLSTTDVTHIHSYLIKRGHQDKTQREAPRWWIDLQSWFFNVVSRLLGWLTSLGY
jgi:quinohemoprotein ethanol dehydrogenase